YHAGPETGFRPPRTFRAPARQVTSRRGEGGGPPRPLLAPGPSHTQAGEPPGPPRPAPPGGARAPPRPGGGPGGPAGGASGRAVRRAGAADVGGGNAATARSGRGLGWPRPGWERVSVQWRTTRRRLSDVTTPANPGSTLLS